MNDYSHDWIATFLANVDPAQTEHEIAFLQRQLPSERFRRMLDICCGLGRHAGALAALGYDVVGIDRDPTMIAEAKLTHPRVRFIAMDVNDLASLDLSFDAAICMWQSFGYLDDASNQRLLASIASKLDVGGRFVLDIYNREFFKSRQGTSTSERAGRKIRETRQMDGDRLRIDLVYNDDASRVDQFDWQLFTLDQVKALGAKCGLTTDLACTGFDESKPASAQSPRMQVDFTRPGTHRLA